MDIDLIYDDLSSIDNFSKFSSRIFEIDQIRFLEKSKKVKKIQNRVRNVQNKWFNLLGALIKRIREHKN